MDSLQNLKQILDFYNNFVNFKNNSCAKVTILPGEGMTLSSSE